MPSQVEARLRIAAEASAEKAMEKRAEKFRRRTH